MLLLYFRSAASAALCSVWMPMSSSVSASLPLSFSTHRHLSCMQNGRIVHFLFSADRTLSLPEEHALSRKLCLFNFGALDCISGSVENISLEWLLSLSFHAENPSGPQNLADSCSQEDLHLFGENDSIHSIIQIWIKQAFLRKVIFQLFSSRVFDSADIVKHVRFLRHWATWWRVYRIRYGPCSRLKRCEYTKGEQQPQWFHGTVCCPGSVVQATSAVLEWSKQKRKELHFWKVE